MSHNLDGLRQKIKVLADRQRQLSGSFMIYGEPENGLPNDIHIAEFRTDYGEHYGPVFYDAAAQRFLVDAGNFPWADLLAMLDTHDIVSKDG